MLTHTERVLAFEHTIRTLFDQEGDTPLVLAFQQNGIQDPSAIINVHQKDIYNLRYTDDQGVERPVPLGHTSLICVLKAYHLHRHQQGDPIGDHWTSITAEMFDEFRIGPDFATATLVATPSTSTSSAMTPTVIQPYARDPVANFKKGIKRD